MKPFTKNNITVKWVRQNEVNDVFKITDNREVSYQSYPRTMMMTCENVYYDLY